MSESRSATVALALAAPVTRLGQYPLLAAVTPGRTLPGLKMPGQYGNETVTAHNLKVAKIIAEDDLVLIEGAVPGPSNQLVTIRGAVKKKNGGKPAKK